MITKDEIKHLAELSRLKISEEEINKMTEEIDSILEYVGQIKNVDNNTEEISPSLFNVMRDDVSYNEPKSYTEDVLQNAPAREDDYLKVKKIL